MFIFKNKFELEEFDAVLDYLHKIYKLSMVARFKKMGQEFATQEARDDIMRIAQENPDLYELMASLVQSSIENEESKDDRKENIEIAHSIIKDSERNFFDRIKGMDRKVIENTLDD